MRYLNNMLIAIPFILFVYAQVFALYFLPQSLVLIHIVVLASMIIILFLIKWNWSFMFIVSTTLLYGFTLTGLAFTGNYIQQQQIEFILMTTVYFVSILSVWYSAHHLQKLKITLEFEKLKNFELQKFVSTHSRLLTNKEFSERVSINLVGLKRRNEMGFLMQISIKVKKNKEQIYKKILAEVIEDSTRDQFDFFTLTDASTFLVFLQNTSEDGCQIVQSRVLDKLREKVNITELPVDFTTKRVEYLQDTLSHLEVGSIA